MLCAGRAAGTVRYAILATAIIKALDRDRLTVREAHARTGIAAADFSRIRNADLALAQVNRIGFGTTSKAF